MQICDWRQLDADIAKITLALSQSAAAPNPFYIVTLLDSPASQRLAAGQWIRSEAPSESAPAFAPRPVRDKIHIGYFSADYHEHATSYLIAELFELHDRDRFRISAISFGPESHGPMRKRLQAACDEFIDVRDKSDAETVALCRAKHIDIAIDLKGFTQDNRLGIFSRRVAPLQVNYLGYPGTLAAPYIDYMIADRTLVPGQSQQHYSEKLIYLPHCYQANDTKRVVAEKSFTRAELGLPTDGFIFCCFNNSYKITPAIFHRWMRILARVENSVLWLLADNPAAVRNLRREAAARYVAPERLIFAERIDLPHHLARHRAADLFLDTLPCNAHTTASDALWAGVPVLTCAGESLAARVAASLLTAIGLPELIASTQDQYELMAVDLAHDREKLAALARKLAENKRDAPLFDTPRFTRDIEAGYEMIHARHRAGEAPEHIDVPDRPSSAIVCSRY
jgi:predicted O-linked N-acetylglucosamine transferase (SPINDLY family)